MDDKQIAEALRVCRNATAGPWGGEGFRVDIPLSDDKWFCFRAEQRDAAFIRHARGNAEGTTGYEAALRELACAQREFDVLQTGHLKLLKAVQDWAAKEGVRVCDACEPCDDPACALAALVADTGPVAPPFAEEEAVRTDGT